MSEPSTKWPRLEKEKREHYGDCDDKSKRLWKTNTPLHERCHSNQLLISLPIPEIRPGSASGLSHGTNVIEIWEVLFPLSADVYSWAQWLPQMLLTMSKFFLS